MTLRSKLNLNLGSNDGVFISSYLLVFYLLILYYILMGFGTVMYNIDD